MAALTLDHLSGGRVSLGVGFGWNTDELADHNVPPGRRRTMLREYLEAMRALWTQEEAEYDGEFVKFGPSWAWPKPVQAHIPVLVGAAGTEKNFKWIAKSADGWITTPQDRGITDAARRFAEIWREHGRDGAPRIVALDGRPDRDRLARWGAAGVTDVLYPAVDSDEVADIVCDPDDDERPLWYVVRRKRTVWDFENDQPKVATGAENAGLKETVRYYRHWRNVDDALAERRGEAPGDDVPPLELPPDEKLAEGEVFHLRVNRIGRSQFGAPPWARSLRFFSAMNTLTESHVAMAQAASMFVAKKVQRGSPDQIARSAMSVLNQTAEIGMAKFGDAPTPGRGALPPDPGSILVENESSRMEPVALQSGSAQAQQTAQIVRAPIAAASGFGQHYMGDASSANLATATSLELPTLMTVQAWQQTMLDLLRWFTDLVVEDAVKAGRIPPKAAQPEADPQDEDDPLEPVGERDELAEYEAPEKPARLMHLSESGDAIEFERRLNRKLGYTLNAPYPGRRNLPDVTALVTQVAQTFDQGGTNIPLRRGLLHFLADAGMNLDDPAGWVEAGLPEATIDAIAQQTLQRTQVPMGPDGKALPQPPAGPGGAPAQGDPTAGPDSGEKPPNAPSVLEAARELGADVAGLWHVAAVDPLLTEGASGGDAAGQ